jgi:hypothetical protein
MTEKKNTSRTAEKFVVRLRDGQRSRVMARANTEHRAMNDICTMAIDRYLDQQEAFDQILLQLQNSMVPREQLEEMARVHNNTQENLLELARLVLAGDPGAHELAAGVAKTGVL